MRTVGALLISLIVLLPALLSSVGQTPPVQVAHILLVNVLDQKGRSIRDLTKENFRVKVNGKPAEVVESTYSIAPRRIVVLLDTSGSMASENYSAKWQVARETLATLLSQSPPETQIAMLTFSSQVNDVIDFSRGRTAIDEWSSMDRVSGPTLGVEQPFSTPPLPPPNCSSHLGRVTRFTPLLMEVITAAS